MLIYLGYLCEIPSRAKELSCVQIPLLLSAAEPGPQVEWTKSCHRGSPQRKALSLHGQAGWDSKATAGYRHPLGGAQRWSSVASA
jgi:hypothetical protein